MYVSLKLETVTSHFWKKALTVPCQLIQSFYNVVQEGMGFKVAS